MRYVLSVAAFATVMSGAAAAAPPATRHDPGTTVVDATGAVVGYLVSGNRALFDPPTFGSQLAFTSGSPTLEREIVSGVWVAMPGFVRFELLPVNLPTFYQSSDCSGTPYFDASNLPVFAEAARDTSKPNTVEVTYPAPPYGFVTMASRFVGSPTPSCQAFPSGPTPVYVGQAATASFTVRFPLSVQ